MDFAHVPTFEALKLPDGWPLLAGVDTGTYMSAALATINPDPYQLIILWEGPNYRYVGGEIDLLDLSNLEWAYQLKAAYNHLRPGHDRVTAWADQNTQFRQEMRRHGINLRGNNRKLEVRVEVLREYVQAKNPPRFLMAPWLTVLPYEMEHAKWPEEHTVGGRYERIKIDDHTLDCVEHIASRRPRSKTFVQREPETFLERYLREHRRPDLPHRHVDVHLGRQ